jgi:hypothetical protein
MRYGGFSTVTEAGKAGLAPRLAGTARFGYVVVIGPII